MLCLLQAPTRFDVSPGLRLARPRWRRLNPNPATYLLIELGMDYTDYQDLIFQASILSGGVDRAKLAFVKSALNMSANSTLSGQVGDQPDMVEDDSIRLDEQELFHGYAPSLLTLATVFCLLFMLVGIPGNLITIIALFRCKKVSYISASVVMVAAFSLFF